MEIVFYVDRRGKRPVREYLERLEASGRGAEFAAVARHVELLREHGVRLGMPYARIIDRINRIYELRPGAHRVAYARIANTCVLLHAWRKRSQSLDRAALAEAIRRFAEWKTGPA